MKVEKQHALFEVRDGAASCDKPPGASVVLPSQKLREAPAVAIVGINAAASILRLLPNRRTLLAVALWVISLSVLLLAWHLATTYRIDWYIRFKHIPSPAQVFNDALHLAQNSKFITNVGVSTRRILIGFSLATLVAVPLGLIVGRYRLASHLIFPALEVLRPIPAIAWVPISIMLWPTNEVSIIFITFLGSFFPILVNTVNGVHAVDPVLFRAARSLGAGEFAVLRHVILPGALPHVFTGLTVGMGVAWVSLIAAEMISGQFGIGYFTWEAYSLIAYPEIVIGMIVIGLLGLICSGVIRFIGRQVMPWIAFNQGR